MNNWICLSVVLAASVLGARAGDEIEGFADAAKWAFTNGPEFPGANGSFSIVEEDGKSACAIAYDFSGGGSYVSAGLRTAVDQDFSAVVFSVKDSQAGPVILRLVDASGECFQFKNKYSNPGDWEELRVNVKKPGVECWGGDGNKSIDLPVKSVWFGVSKGGGREPSGTLLVTGLKFEAD